MELDTRPILKSIHHDDATVDEFLSAWFDTRDCIEAHTSGSTGCPKAILLKKSDMVASARVTNKFFAINEGSNLLCPLSANYIAGKMMIVRAIISQANLWMITPTASPDTTIIPTIDMMAVVPSQVIAMLENPEKLYRVRNLLIGGAPLPAAIESRLATLPLNSYITYGMTETCSHIALRRVGDMPVYRALDDITFSTDNRSCLIINSSSRTFRSLVTNDIVELVDSHNFRWLGRYDNVINSGGIKVYPEQIERKIASLIPAGLHYYVSSEPHHKWGNVPILIIERGDYDTEELLSAVRLRVTKPERPNRIITVSDIPMAANGKIMRRKPIL